MRPESKTSNGSLTTVPPASLTFATVSSALSTWMYVFQVGVPAPSGELMAATSRPRIRAMKYLPGESGGIAFSLSQPNSAP